MSNVSGTIDFSLGFSDSTSRETKSVLKSITLSENAEATGTAVIVAIMSGTVGTASINIGLEPTTYRNASGNLVSFSNAGNITRVALVSNGLTNPLQLSDNDLGVLKLISYGGVVASCRWVSSIPASGMTLQPLGTGTADYTIVVTKES